jgi:hypothetical protein
MNRSLSLALVVLSFIAGILTLDAVGVFIYSGYLFAYIAASAVGIVLSLVIGRSLGAGRRLSVLISAIFILLLGAVSLTSMLPTSARKSFYLATTALKHGASIQDVKAALRRFDSSPFEASASSLTFSFQSSPGTVDHAIAEFKDGRLDRIEFSPD